MFKTDSEVLKQTIKSMYKNKDYTKGRFPFWYVFDVPRYGVYTLSVVELIEFKIIE